MRDRLAEELLAAVMDWQPADVARERPILQALAAVKYDDYQQFSPGRRFVESLANWLEQFKEPAERRVAYDFFRSQLIFVSNAEMNHLVSIAYPDHIRPHLLAKAANESGLNAWHVGRVQNTPAFRILERQTLFLALSDGARTDVFRRTNPHLTHEQVRQSHELSAARIGKLLGKLRDAVKTILQHDPSDEVCFFRTIVLLDDFSASGLSYLRTDSDGAPDGKVASFVTALFDPQNPTSTLINIPDAEILLVLYMASSHALDYLEAEMTRLCSAKGVRSRVLCVHPLPENVRITKGQDLALDALLEKYYDDTNETSSTRLGGTDLRYGFAACGLPLILGHNTPNNSLGILWADGPKMRPLFARVTRHKDTV